VNGLECHRLRDLLNLRYKVDGGEQERNALFLLFSADMKEFSSK
jgi:hypothetical protein